MHEEGDEMPGSTETLLLQHFQTNGITMTTEIRRIASELGEERVMPSHLSQLTPELLDYYDIEMDLGDLLAITSDPAPCDYSSPPSLSSNPKPWDHSAFPSLSSMPTPSASSDSDWCWTPIFGTATKKGIAPGAEIRPLPNPFRCTWNKGEAPVVPANPFQAMMGLRLPKDELETEPSSLSIASSIPVPGLGTIFRYTTGNDPNKCLAPKPGPGELKWMTSYWRCAEPGCMPGTIENAIVFCDSCKEKCPKLQRCKSLGHNIIPAGLALNMAGVYGHCDCADADIMGDDVCILSP